MGALAKVAKGGAVQSLMVEIEETPGQLCRYRASLAVPRPSTDVKRTRASRANRA